MQRTAKTEVDPKNFAISDPGPQVIISSGLTRTPPTTDLTNVEQL